jgi:type II secretory pathway pseudopilin PulG
MKIHPSSMLCRRASTLVEAVIAIGVLSVAIPLVYATLAQAGKSELSSEAETRCTWMIPACLDEIRASRAGRSQYFNATVVGQTFPAAGEIWALAFSADGKPVGKIPKTAYENGLKSLDGKPVLYLASMMASAATIKAGEPPVMNVRISIDYPAAAAAAKRQKLDFHTRIP